MGVGSLSMIVPMYNAEVAPPEVRGSLIALQQLAICFGIMISFWIDYGTNYIGGTGADQTNAAWLVPICLQLFPAVVLFVGILFMPFSPRWLVHHNREAEAMKVLATLRGLPQDHELVELEFLEIKAQSLFEKRTVAEYWPNLRELTAWNTFKLQFVAIGSLFRTKAMFRRVIVATVTMFFQQWTVYPTLSKAVKKIQSNNPVGHQRHSILRTHYLHFTRSILQHRLAPGHWCGRNCHVSRNHPLGSLHRQTWPQAYPYNWCNWNGYLPHHHCGHSSQEQRSMAYSQERRLGSHCDGLVVRHPLRIFLGPLRLDYCSRDLATEQSSIRHCFGRFE